MLLSISRWGDTGAARRAYSNMSTVTFTLAGVGLVLFVVLLVANILDEFLHPWEGY